MSITVSKDDLKKQVNNDLQDLVECFIPECRGQAAEVLGAFYRLEQNKLLLESLKRLPNTESATWVPKMFKILKSLQQDLVLLVYEDASDSDFRAKIAAALYAIQDVN